MKTLLVAAIGALTLVVFTGCRNDGLSTLSGQVTIDGQPAPKGVSLEFQATAEGGSTSYGATDASGRYEAEFTFQKKGIQPGEHLVRLLPSDIEIKGVDGKNVAGAAAAFSKLPKDYYSEIQKIKVEPGSNSVDFDLKTK